MGEKRAWQALIRRYGPVLIAARLAMVPVAADAAPPDWSNVPGKEITLFYPAQMSSELLLTTSDHSGAPKFRAGDNCRVCHGGHEKTSGELLVKDKSSEPTPIAGKPGFVTALVKFAVQDDQIFVHLDLTSGDQPDAKMDPRYATKVAMMLDDGTTAEAGRAGCWGACHDDLENMPSAKGRSLSMYLARSRTKMSRSGGEAIKSADELASLRAAGVYLEYWQTRLNPGAPPVTVAGTMLDKRQELPGAVVTAEASYAHNSWSVTFARRLAPGDPYKAIVAGKTYSVAFAVHDGHAAGRYHYVSLEHSMVVGAGTADFVAVTR